MGLEELFVDIPGYSNYRINMKGEVYSIISDKVLSPYINGGYYCVDLYPGKVTKKNIHRLLAENFIPNPENKVHVNHIDGNKLNNALNNLEWNTAKENTQHSFKNGLQIVPKGKDNPMYGRVGGNHNNAIPVQCIKTGKLYPSPLEASQETGLSKESIKRHCRGEVKKEILFNYRKDLKGKL